MAEAWLILGASSAVARAFALAAARAGADILLAGRDAADLRATAADVQLRTGRQAEVLAFDALARGDHVAFAADVAGRAATVNVFLAFAVMADGGGTRPGCATAEDIIATNYLGAVSILEQLAPYLERQGRGRVIVLGSVAGDRGRPSNYLYGSSKAALHVYLQGLRARLHRHGVSVLTVKPGYTDTALTWGLPGLFLVNPPEALARRCLRAAAAGRNEIYVPWFWRPLMACIRMIPEVAWKRLRL